MITCPSAEILDRISSGPPPAQGVTGAEQQYKQLIEPLAGFAADLLALGTPSSNGDTATEEMWDTAGRASQALRNWLRSVGRAANYAMVRSNVLRIADSLDAAATQVFKLLMDE